MTLEDLADDIQFTKERETDLLKKVIDTNGNIFILHVEFQRKNDNKNMVYRMADLKEVMKTIEHFFKIERDPFYIEGQEKGIEKGEYKKAIEIAIELLKEKLPISFIAKTTKLSVEEIEQL